MQPFSDFYQIQTLLQKVVEDNLLTESDLKFLNNLLNSPIYSFLPVTASEAIASQLEPLYFLKQALDMLANFTDGNLEKALITVQETNKLSFFSDAFEGWFFRCVVKLAQQANFPNAENIQNLFLKRYENYQQVYNAAFENSFEALGSCLGILEESTRKTAQPIPVSHTINGDYLFASRNGESFIELSVIIVSTDDSYRPEVRRFSVASDAVNLLEPDENNLKFNVLIDLPTLAKEAVDLIANKLHSNWTARLITTADHNKIIVTESSRSVIHFFDAGILLFLTIANHLSKQALVWLKEMQIKEIVLIAHSDDAINFS